MSNVGHRRREKPAIDIAKVRGWLTWLLVFNLLLGITPDVLNKLGVLTSEIIGSADGDMLFPLLMLSASAVVLRFSLTIGVFSGILNFMTRVHTQEFWGIYKCFCVVQVLLLIQLIVSQCLAR